MMRTFEWNGEAIPDEVAAAVQQSRRIVIDGVSGSGKSTLALQLAAIGDFTVLPLDNWYPGWNGLASGAKTAEELLAGQRDDYPLWNWTTNTVDRLVSVDRASKWIVEGCGALTPTTRQYCDLAIWVEAPVQVAKKRALSRDGETYEPWWEIWHQQELAHWKRNSPSHLADLVIATYST